jgi:hypothetical protein
MDLLAPRASRISPGKKPIIPGKIPEASFDNRSLGCSPGERAYQIERGEGA